MYAAALFLFLPVLRDREFRVCPSVVPDSIDPSPARPQPRQGDTPHTLTDEEFAKLSDMTEGCSGADISICVREALMEPLRSLTSSRWLVDNRHA